MTGFGKKLSASSAQPPKELKNADESKLPCAGLPAACLGARAAAGATGRAGEGREIRGALRVLSWAGRVTEQVADRRNVSNIYFTPLREFQI